MVSFVRFTRSRAASVFLRSVAFALLASAAGCGGGGGSSGGIITVVSVVSSADSTLVADRTTGVRADGKDFATVTVTVLDKDKKPVKNAFVNFTETGPSHVTDAAPTDDNGETTTQVTATAAGTVVVSAAAAVVNGDKLEVTQVTQTASIEFVQVAIGGQKSTITASSTSVTADGVATATITVNVRDLFDVVAPGQKVDFAATGTVNTLSATTGTTDSSGNVSITIASTKAELKTITATVTPAAAGATTFALSIEVSFVAGSPAQLSFRSIGNQTAGVTFLPQVEIQDKNGNLTGASAQISLRVNSVNPTIILPSHGPNIAPGNNPRIGIGQGLNTNPVPVQLGTVTNRGQLSVSAASNVTSYNVKAGFGGSSVIAAVAQNGVATFPFTLFGANTYTLRADSTSFGAATSGAFAVGANPTLSQLQFLQGPLNSNGIASPGAQFLNRVKVGAMDQYGNTITTLQGFNITLALAPAPPAATTLETGATGNVVASVTLPTVDGVSTFSDFRLVPNAPPPANTPITGYQLRATATLNSQNFQSDSAAFALVHQDDPCGLIFATQPQSHANNNSQSPNFLGTTVKLRIIKGDGTAYSQATGSLFAVQLALPNSIDDGFMLNVAPTGSVAVQPATNPASLPIEIGSSESLVADIQINNTKPNPRLNGTVGTYYLTANATAPLQGVTLYGATSNLFSVTAGPAFTLLWKGFAGPVNVGIAPLATTGTVLALDSMGNLATSFNGNVAVSIGTDGNAGNNTTLNGVAAHGPVNVAAVNGIATGSFSFNQIGASDFGLNASFATPPNPVDSSLPAVSVPFRVLAPGNAARLVFVKQPRNASPAAPIGEPDFIQVQALDVAGAPVNTFGSTAGDAISLQFAVPSANPAFGFDGTIGLNYNFAVGGGTVPVTLNGTTTRTPNGTTGTATFDDISINRNFSGAGAGSASCRYALLATGSIPGNAGAFSGLFDIVAGIGGSPHGNSYPPTLRFDTTLGETVPGLLAGPIGTQIQKTVAKPSTLFHTEGTGGTIQAYIIDDDGNVITTQSTSVTVELQGKIGAVLGGTTTRQTVSGVALFNDLTIDTATTPAPATTLDASMDTLELSDQGAALNVASTNGFDSFGILLVETNFGPQTVIYSGKTGTAFTGLLGSGFGTMSTGGAVTAAQTLFCVSAGFERNMTAGFTLVPP